MHSSVREIGRPENVGILAIEVYFPSQYVDQAELEEYDGVSPGKYTLGLGQKKMGFCTDLEDINSLCLTVVHNLVERQGIKYSDIGRLEVGTETLVDKSKSVKSVLMQLLTSDDVTDDVTDIEGVDCMNACYGGTAAVFNAVNWLESRAWDGRRLALVVCADIAVYAAGGARPTGGAGAIALLLGPQAPLVLQSGLRASYMRHAYDFYKPDLTSEYPVVDGKLSIQCYLGALDRCYQLYRHKAASLSGESVSLDSFDSVIFHCPYGKLVQKSFARLMFNDFLVATSGGVAGGDSGDIAGYCQDLYQFRDRQLEKTYFDRDVEKAFMAASNSQFELKTRPSLLLAANIGNMYTPSVYSCLVSLLLSKPVEELANSRICVFSYGSGLASSMFSIKCMADNGCASKLHSLVQGLSDVKQRLENRRKVSPQQFVDALQLRQDSLHKVPMTPVSDSAGLFSGTYYLTSIDTQHRRFYLRH